MNFSFSSKQQLIEALQLAGVSANSIELLTAQMENVVVKSNQVLIKSGQINTHLYYVLSGGFVCRFVSEDAEIERTINFYLNELHPVMACIDSYFLQTKTSCELRAISDSNVLAISKKAIDNLIAIDTNLKLLFDQLLTNALIEENDLKLKIISCKPDTFYQYIIQEFPAVIQKVPSKYIAELMGISAEWLSKLKSKHKFS
ncbi:MAG: cyclic nucleotide-binding domain-containing protein [Chitinophagales bacterium]